MVKSIKCWPSKNTTGMFRANCKVNLDNQIEFSATIMNGSKGLWVALPGKKADKIDEKTGKAAWYPDVKFLSKDLEKEVTELVLAEYNKLTGGKVATPTQDVVEQPAQKKDSNIPF